MRRHSTVPSPRRPLRAGPIALIVLLGIAAHWPALAAPFLWDDTTAILQNPTIRSFSPLWRPLLPPAETPVARRPIANLSFAFNYALDGLNPVTYHAWNLGVHLLNALLLFAIVRRTLTSGRMREQFGAAAGPTALAATLLWVVHPFTSEVVAYATQRTESMVACFVLLTLYCAIRALDGDGSRRWRTRATVACVAGMLTKESMVVAPLIVMLYDRAFAFGSWREAFTVRRRLYTALAGSWLVLAMLLWVRPHSTVGFSSGVSAFTYALNQAQLIPHYLRLAIWPDALVLDYGFPLPLTLDEVFSGIVVLSVLLAATLFAWIRWPAAGFLGATFFLTLLPTSSVIPIATEVGAERRMYLPVAALAVLAIALSEQLRRRAAIGGTRPARTLVSAVAVLCVAALGARSVSRNQRFASPQTIWRTSVERHPHGRARAAYATALIDAGHHDAGIGQLRLAIRDFPPARMALATELAAIGGYDEAIVELSKFLGSADADRGGIRAGQFLGDLLVVRGRIGEAIAAYESAIALAHARGWPEPGTAHLTLAELYLRRNDVGRGEPHARLAVQLRPADAKAHNLFGIALASSGRIDEARDHFRLAATLDAGNSDIRANLARAEQLLAER